MILRSLLLLALLPAALTLAAQPANDDCAGAIDIPDVTNFCTTVGAYSNVGATPSGYGPASCFNGSQNDVWFKFTAVATDVSIIVNGASGQGAGGNMLLPRAALYLGSCGGTISQLECQASVTLHIVELYQGGLTPGQTYLLRVQSFAPAGGTFQICVNNYNSPVEPTSDCPTASILCDKSPFTVQTVVGAGTDIKELDDALCFSNGVSVNNETNSTWFTWICQDPGTLTFTLTPNNPADDLDFVLYELPNGVGDCSNRQVLRCMASGDFNFPSKCMGPTGLKAGETDVSEPAGCGLASQSNYLAPLVMQAGKTYALAINNFTSTGNGFSIEWGGTGTFRGPVADFNTFPPKPSYCIAEEINFLDASTFALGAITQYDWYFGLDATPTTASGPGFHSVKFNTEGVKTVALVVGTDLGCQVTYLRQVNIETCCDTYNAMQINSNLQNLDCYGDSDGAIDLTVASVTTVGFEWSNGSNMPDQNALGAGSYTVTITNEATCDTVLTYTITSPPAIEAIPQVKKPTCNGGKDGAITLQTSGGVPPYQYDWKDGLGFVNANSRANLPVGLYFVTIRDANDCETTLAVDVNELVLELDPALQAFTEPSCNGFSDGSITIAIVNGLPPYQYSFNGGPFTPNNKLSGIPAGSYTVEVQDANDCKGFFTFAIGEPDPLEVQVQGKDISCFGLKDGEAQALVTGGTAPYTYQWSDFQQSDLAKGLPAGTYGVTVTDDRGCVASTSVTLAQPPELFLFPGAVQDVRCFGEANGSLAVQAAGGTPGYSYSLDGGPFQADPTFAGLKAGTYQLTVKDAQGCTAILPMTVDQPPPLIVDAGPDLTIELGYSTGIQANVSPPFTPVTLVWVPDSTLNCATCASVEAFPVNTTTYTVTATDDAGCVAADQVTVVVIKVRNVFIPNSFSPDYNGINDRFNVLTGIGVASVPVLRVYNRWGGLVYEGLDLPLNDAGSGWDGIFRGRLMDPDVFAFYALVRFIDGEEIVYKGDVQLVR